MGNWGGVVAQGLAGFVSGAGKGGLDHIVEEQKIAAQKLRDAELSKQRMVEFEHQSKITQGFTAKENQLTRDQTEAQSSRAHTAQLASLAISAGQAETSSRSQAEIERHNKYMEVNPAIISPEAKELLRAQADYYKSYADLKDRSTGTGTGAKTSSKNDFPDVVEKKTDAGDMLIDRNTGIIGRIVPGEDKDVPAKTHWFKPDEPGRPAKPAHVEWTDSDGKKVNLSDLYPKLREREMQAKGLGSSPSNDGQTWKNADGKLMTKGDIVEGMHYLGGDPAKKENYTATPPPRGAQPGVVDGGITPKRFERSGPDLRQAVAALDRKIQELGASSNPDPALLSSYMKARKEMLDKMGMYQ